MGKDINYTPKQVEDTYNSQTIQCTEYNCVASSVSTWGKLEHLIRFDTSKLLHSGENEGYFPAVRSYDLINLTLDNETSAKIKAGDMFKIRYIDLEGEEKMFKIFNDNVCINLLEF